MTTTAAKAFAAVAADYCELLNNTKDKERLPLVTRAIAWEDATPIAREMKEFAQELEAPLEYRVIVRVQQGHKDTEEPVFGELVYALSRVATPVWIVPFQCTQEIYKRLRVYKWRNLERRAFWFRNLHQLHAAANVVIHQRSLTQPLTLDVRHKISFEVVFRAPWVNPFDELSPDKAQEHPQILVSVSTVNAGGDKAVFRAIQPTSYNEHGLHGLPECRQQGPYGASIFTGGYMGWKADPAITTHTATFKNAVFRPSKCVLTDSPAHNTFPDPQLRRLSAEFTQGNSQSNCPTTYCLDYSDRERYRGCWIELNTGQNTWTGPRWPATLTTTWFSDARRLVSLVNSAIAVWQRDPEVGMKLLATETVHSVQFHSRYDMELVTRIMTGSHAMHDVLQTVVTTYNVQENCFRVYEHRLDCTLDWTAPKESKVDKSYGDRLWVDLQHVETSLPLSSSPKSGNGNGGGKKNGTVTPVPVDPERRTGDSSRFIHLRFDLRDPEEPRDETMDTSESLH